MTSTFRVIGKRLDRERRGRARKTRKGRAAEACSRFGRTARAWISCVFAPFARLSRSRYSPLTLLKRQALVLLFRSTAAAFECKMPRLSGLSREQCLLAYARFSALWAEQALRSGRDPSNVRERLYRNAYRLGRMPGWLLHVRSVDRVMALGRLLYGILDIDFQGNGSGEIAIDRCYFSSFYSPEVCRLMSGMDRGLMAGLAGGGELVFTERITEGGCCCRARFTLQEQTR